MSSSPISSSSSDLERLGAFVHFRDVPLAVEVMLGIGAIALRSLLALQPGSVVRLQSSAGGDLRSRSRACRGNRRSRDRRGHDCGARHAHRLARRRGADVSAWPLLASGRAACREGELTRGIGVVVLFGAARRSGVGPAPRRARPLHAQAAHVRIEATVPLGERRSLMVVAVEGRRLLLGLTPMQVSLVTELQRRRRRSTRRSRKRRRDAPRHHGTTS